MCKLTQLPCKSVSPYYVTAPGTISLSRAPLPDSCPFSPSSSAQLTQGICLKQPPPDNQLNVPGDPHVDWTDVHLPVTLEVNLLALKPPVKALLENLSGSHSGPVKVLATLCPADHSHFWP